ncbi:protein NO VEIN domain-containing protein [Candidatus Latescibacterota bacterium]
MSDNKHENYHTLNLIGYGLAKFDLEFVNMLGFPTKQAFYRYIVEIGVAETSGVVKNRQDLFDHFFDNKRKGWWQKGNAYIHRKIFIDSLFGDLDAEAYARNLDVHLKSEFLGDKEIRIKPILKSKFKQLQYTGHEAELYFIQNYKEINCFKNGTLEDARLWGDGYDFQIQVDSHYYLAEIKGVRYKSGSIRLTENEYEKAKEYKSEFALSVVSNLHDQPKINVIFDPLSSIELEKQLTMITQLSYHSKVLNW